MTNDLRIVCTVQVPYGNSPECARIVSVGASEGEDLASIDLTVNAVIAKMDQGATFYTLGEISGKRARVEKYWCMRCTKYHIRSTADSTTDNNLDSLRYCRWKKAV